MLTPSAARRLGTATALHALTWLSIANGVGLLLALLLVFPRLGGALGPLTWGRWVPLHLDLQFYGWVTIPLLGVLLRVLAPERDQGWVGSIALAWWSASLAASSLHWLAGHSSGKTFLEWTGAGRVALAAGGAALVVAGLILLIRGWRDSSEPRIRQLVRTAIVVCALPAPLVLVLATSPRTYPAINPDSGGATSASTAASVLGVVTVLLATPWGLGLPSTTPRRRQVALVVLVAHLGAVVALLGGDHSHGEPLQLLALVSTAVWLPLLVWLERAEPWPRAARAWLGGAAGWAVVVLVTGVAAGWPGVAERWKFTNALVGHVHAALAGLISSWLIAVLVVLVADSSLATALGNRHARWAWQLGLVAQVVVLGWLGTLEGATPGLVARASGDVAVNFAYATRLLAGIPMCAASWWWWNAARSGWARLGARP